MKAIIVIVFGVVLLVLAAASHNTLDNTPIEVDSYQSSCTYHQLFNGLPFSVGTSRREQNKQTQRTKETK